MFQSPRGGGRRKRALLTIAVAALGAAGLMGQSALASPVRPPAVPAFEQYFADHNVDAKAYLVGHASGDQIYTCQSSTNGSYKWTGPRPDATLTGQNEHVYVARHFAGPTWQA